MASSSSSSNKSYVGTILLDFPVQPEFLEEKKNDTLEQGILKELKRHLSSITLTHFGPVTSSGRIFLFCAEKGVTITVRTYPARNTVTLTIEYDLKESGDQPLLSFEEIGELEKNLTSAFQGGVKKTGPLPQLKRALDFDVYFQNSDKQLLEYDVQEMVFDDRSEFQHVQIARTLNYGNILILDGMVNLAEADLAYTENLMCRGKTNYKGKDVLILGGGDGALLYELRREGCNSITMIEIDEMVMESCKVHLRKACYDTLDNYKHENYEIIVGDCIPFMEKCKEGGRLFDYVFGDLTDIPISPEATGEIWDFFKLTLRLSFSILKEGGTFFTHIIGVTAPQSLTMFETTVKESLESDYDVECNQTQDFVPSFKEKWVFYQIKKIKQMLEGWRFD